MIGEHQAASCSRSIRQTVLPVSTSIPAANEAPWFSNCTITRFPWTTGEDDMPTSFRVGRVLNRQPANPLQISVEIEAGQIVRGIEGKHPLSVGGRRIAGDRAERMIGRVTGHPKLAPPELLAGLGVEAKQIEPILPKPGGAGHEDAILADDRSGRSPAGEVDDPGDVFLGLQVERHRQPGRLGHGSAVGTAKLGPASGFGGGFRQGPRGARIAHSAKTVKGGRRRCISRNPTTRTGGDEIVGFKRTRSRSGSQTGRQGPENEQLSRLSYPVPR